MGSENSEKLSPRKGERGNVQRENEYLKEEIDELLKSIAALTEANVACKVEIRRLENKINRLTDENASLREHEECFNETYEQLQRDLSACERFLEMERAANTDLKHEQEHILEINDNLLAKIEDNKRLSSETCSQLQEELSSCRHTLEAERKKRKDLEDNLKHIREANEIVRRAHRNTHDCSEATAWSVDATDDFSGERVDLIFQDETDLDSEACSNKEKKNQAAVRRRLKKAQVRVRRKRKYQATPIPPPVQYADIDNSDSVGARVGTEQVRALPPEQRTTSVSACHGNLERTRRTLSQALDCFFQCDLFSVLGIVVRSHEQGFYIIDKSREGRPPMEVVICRPLVHLSSLVRPGDCVLLRNIEVCCKFPAIYLRAHTNSECYLWRHVRDSLPYEPIASYGFVEKSELEEMHRWWQSEP